jgi:hypothetical protein
MQISCLRENGQLFVNTDHFHDMDIGALEWVKEIIMQLWTGVGLALGQCTCSHVCEEW